MSYFWKINNYCKNVFQLAKIAIFQHSRIHKFIQTQIDFQYRSVKAKIELPKNIQDWWAYEFQNISVDFANDEIRQSADQLLKKGRIYTSKNSELIHIRLAKMVNDISTHNASKQYCVDTLEAPEKFRDLPTFARTRKPHTKNRFLWPSFPHQTIGKPQFLTMTHIDHQKFENKIPKIVWRGSQNGHFMRNGQRISLTKLLIEIAESKASLEEYIESLSQAPRFKAVHNFFNHENCDIGFTSSQASKKMYSALPNHYFKPKLITEQFEEFRYILAIAGSDLATNLYKALDSNSVVFKVNAPYEGFLEGQLKPWKHYIPIREDLSDLIEKFEWCESNPDRCKEISQTAKETMLLAKSKYIRRKILSQIIKEYEADFF